MGLSVEYAVHGSEHISATAPAPTGASQPLMDLLIIAPNARSAALAAYLRDLAVAWAELGHRVAVHAARTEPLAALSEEFVHNGVRLLLASEVNAASLDQAISEVAPVAAHLVTASLPPDYESAVSVFRSGIPVLESVHGTHTGAKVGFFAKRKYRAHPRSGYLAVSFSPAVLDAISEHIPVLADRFMCIDAGIRLPRPIPSDLDRRCPDPDWARFVTTTRLNESAKDAGTLIRAFAMVGRRLPNATLQIIGDGSDRHAVESLAHECGIAARVQFSGWMDDVIPALRVADVFVYSSRGESFARPCVRAAAVGLPIVASDAPGCRIAIGDAGCGLLVPHANPAAFAEAMLAVVLEPERYRSMSKAGSAHASRFDISRHASVLADLIGQMLRSG